MTIHPDREAVGTLMRHVLELLDGDVATVYRDAGVPDYRPRFSPAVRALVTAGPMSIRDLAAAIGVTHSAASQTVAQMTKAGFITLAPGKDARQRIAHLTPRTRALLPLIHSEWTATTAALRDLDSDLPSPLADVLLAAAHSLAARPFRTRMPLSPGDLSPGDLSPGDQGVGRAFCGVAGEVVPDHADLGRTTATCSLSHRWKD